MSFTTGPRPCNSGRTRIVVSLALFSIVSSISVAACGVSDRSGFDGKANGFDNDGGGADLDRDPITCAEATRARTYVGCDYWATVTGNVVPDIFDFAVVVSNSGQTEANVTVTGPNNVAIEVKVAPGTLEKVFLPWVPALKGDGVNIAGQATPFSSSVLARKSAYHLVSSVPVVVYQFSPLEFAGKGGPSGKSWSECPELGGPGSGCFSYSNDASLLLPSAAWTGNYRVLGIHGWSNVTPQGTSQPVLGSFAAITASQDGTKVKVALGAKAKVLAGSGIAAGGPGKVLEIALDAGDVAQIVTEKGDQFDLSGSLVQSDKPVQVISGVQCINVPADTAACDHVEESVLPAEALGKKYVVTTPTRPSGTPGLHVVRFVGNRDDTKLTYAPSKPAGCPDGLSAGEVAQCDGPVSTDFVVSGTQEFGIATFMVGAARYEASNRKAKGDPSQTVFASTEQFRTSYLFLTPDDYDISYAVIVGPEAANPVLDGAPVSGFEPLAEGFGVWRVTLARGKNGAHTLSSSLPVGLQAMGYGAFTSYQFPGGLDVKRIAPPPPK
jgi:IgGFc binding protein